MQINKQPMSEKLPDFALWFTRHCNCDQLDFTNPYIHRNFIEKLIANNQYIGKIQSSNTNVTGV